MRYSQLFGKTMRDAPKEAETANHRLLTQAGYIRQLMAGVYSYLPLGLRVLRKIEQIVREEMNAVGGQEVFMPALHPSAIWKQSGGWDSVDVLFKLKSRTGKDYALGLSHEEVVTPLAREAIHGHKDLPLALYQIQWKFRDELRSKSGILRGREFLMKDMYSWHANQKDFEQFYEKVKKAYLKIFTRLGLVAKVTEASGGSFSEKVSYEFEVLTDAGEANILYCNACDYCVNVDDIQQYKEGDACPSCKKSTLESAKAAEVGNIFDLGQKYVKAFDLPFIDADGQRKYPVMGCYGIGLTRTIGVIVEKFHDDKGIIWPESVTPFDVHVVDLRKKEPADAKALAGKEGRRKKEVVEQLEKAGIEILWDDREGVSAGTKFADADLIGIPWRVVVSERLGEKVELKARSSEKSEELSVEELISKFSARQRLSHVSSRGPS